MSKLYNLKYFSYIMASSSSNKKEIILFDFTNENITKDVSDWYEVSDTVRTVGMSKGKKQGYIITFWNNMAFVGGTNLERNIGVH